MYTVSSLFKQHGFFSSTIVRTLFILLLQSQAEILIRALSISLVTGHVPTYEDVLLSIGHNFETCSNTHIRIFFPV